MAKKAIVHDKKEVGNLPALIRTISDIQHTRLVLEGRARNLNEASYDDHISSLLHMEEDMKAQIKVQLRKEYPVHHWIISQKGLSHDLAGQLIGTIIDIEKFSNISKLWAYFGLAVVEVCQTCKKRYYPPMERTAKILHIAQRLMDAYEAKTVKDGQTGFDAKAKAMVCTCEKPVIRRTTQKAKEGVLSDWNPRAKSLAYKVGTQFIKQGDFYRKLYDQFKAEYEQRPDLKAEVESKKGKRTKGENGSVVETSGTSHIHRMAMRRVEKVFLAHLWLVWRGFEGLPMSKPFVIDQMKHADFIEPPAPNTTEIKQLVIDAAEEDKKAIARAVRKAELKQKKEASDKGIK